jgi:hypothetical protein
VLDLERDIEQDGLSQLSRDAIGPLRESSHFEALNRRNVETVKANMSPALFDHELEGDHQHDVEEGGKLLRELMQRIPDLKVELRDVIADRDKVIVWAVWSGRDVQNGGALEFHGFVEWRIAGDKFVERWATATPLAEVKSQPKSW